MQYLVADLTASGTGQPWECLNYDQMDGTAESGSVHYSGASIEGAPLATRASYWWCCIHEEVWVRALGGLWRRHFGSGYYVLGHNARVVSVSRNVSHHRSVSAKSRMKHSVDRSCIDNNIPVVWGNEWF